MPVPGIVALWGLCLHQALTVRGFTPLSPAAALRSA
jgi:hypothetical protein